MIAALIAYGTLFARAQKHGWVVALIRPDVDLGRPDGPAAMLAVFRSRALFRDSDPAVIVELDSVEPDELERGAERALADLEGGGP